MVSVIWFVVVPSIVFVLLVDWVVLFCEFRVFRKRRNLAKRLRDCVYCVFVVSFFIGLESGEWYGL